MYLIGVLTNSAAVTMGTAPEKVQIHDTVISIAWSSAVPAMATPGNDNLK